jgi:hypothetical protein
MGSVLTRAGRLCALTGIVALGAALGSGAVLAELSDRHAWHIELHTAYVAASSPHRGWPDGGLGKLRYDEQADGLSATRLLGVYRGRLARTVWGTVVADYIDDMDGGLGVTEAFLEVRPVPRSALEHRFKVGAFYPPLSLENGDIGWESPFTESFSAINTWLGEEIRPIGAEWSMRRKLGVGSPHELRAFASLFWGNDPAGTLLYWRGWALHDRQARLNDRLAMPPAPQWRSGAIVGFEPQAVEPIDEIDHDAGAYAGFEWRYARRASVQLALYDNRADPHAFSAGQWGWRTRFAHVGAQIALPGGFGLITQWLDGDTRWVIGARPNGTLAPMAELVEDGFDARFAMLTRLFGARHRVSLRYDEFDVERHEEPPAEHSDAGHAWTAAYRFVPQSRFEVGIEWLRIESRRDLWTETYGAPHGAAESEVRLSFGLELGPGR